jgi:hypothetical protein
VKDPVDGDEPEDDSNSEEEENQDEVEVIVPKLRILRSHKTQNLSVNTKTESR